MRILSKLLLFSFNSQVWFKNRRAKYRKQEKVTKFTKPSNPGNSSYKSETSVEDYIRETTNQTPLAVPPSITIPGEKMTVETKVITTQHGSRPSTGRTSNNTTQVFSHQGQPYTYKKHTVGQYDTSWQCANPRTHNLVVSTRDGSSLGCPVGDFDACRGRNLSNSFCVRKPTTSSVDLWRFQAGLQHGNNQWTAPVGCIPYWTLHIYQKRGCLLFSRFEKDVLFLFLIYYC